METKKKNYYPIIKSSDAASSMYANLRTNLPVQCMAFPDFPFQSLETSFPGHREVLNYLINYAEHHELENILFNSPVTSVTRQNKEWSISTPDQAWSLSLLKNPNCQKFDSFLEKQT